VGVFQKGKKNSKYSYLDEKLRRLDEDLKKTGLVSSTKVQENIVEAPKITLPKNPSKEDIRLVSEYLENHSKSNWRNEYRVENGQKTKEEKVEEEISKLRIQRKPQKKLDCSTCVTESDLKSKKIIKEEVTFEDKVNKILQIYNEGLLNIPPSESTPDPLTPTDGKFVTFSQLNDHYNLFINRIQQQLSTLGGGGEVRLQYLDDIVGIATNASVYDGKFLKYDNSIGKFVFDTVGPTGLTTETQTLNNVLQLGNSSSTGINVGLSTFTNVKTSTLGVSGVTTTNHFDVSGISTFNGNVFNYGNVKLFNTSKLICGGGNDLQIYNDGLNSYIVDVGAGDLFIRGTAAIDFQNAIGSEYYARFNVDSSVELYFDNSLKFQTVMNGATTYGTHFATAFSGNGSALTGITTSQISGLSTVASTGSYDSLTNKPIIPVNVGDLTNNVGFVTSGIVNGYSTISYVDNAVAGIVSAAPGALDTLNELAAALGDDANFATTITNSLATKANLTGANFTGVVTATSFSGNASSATYATLSGIATYASTAGIATYALTAGVSTTATTSTNVVGGQASVTQLNVSSGIATFGNQVLLYNATPSIKLQDSNGTEQWANLNFDSSVSNNYCLNLDLRLFSNTPHFRIRSYAGGVDTATFMWITGGATANSDFGFVGIGSTVPTAKLDVNGNMRVSGVVTATDFNSSSDLSLKENIEVIDNPLSKLLELRGVTFDWKETKKSGIGVVAQDVEKVLPQAVGGVENHKTVNYNAIIGLLVESVKQQQKEIEDLRKRLS